MKQSTFHVREFEPFNLRGKNSSVRIQRYRAFKKCAESTHSLAGSDMCLYVFNLEILGLPQTKCTFIFPETRISTLQMSVSWIYFVLRLKVREVLHWYYFELLIVPAHFIDVNERRRPLKMQAQTKSTSISQKHVFQFGKCRFLGFILRLFNFQG